MTYICVESHVVQLSGISEGEDILVLNVYQEEQAPVPTWLLRLTICMTADSLGRCPSFCWKGHLFSTICHFSKWLREIGFTAACQKQARLGTMCRSQRQPLPMSMLSIGSRLKGWMFPSWLGMERHQNLSLKFGSKFNLNSMSCPPHICQVVHSEFWFREYCHCTWDWDVVLRECILEVCPSTVT